MLKGATLPEVQNIDITTKKTNTQALERTFFTQEIFKTMEERRSKKLASFSSVKMNWEKRFPMDTLEDLGCRKSVFMLAFTERNYVEDLEILVNLGIEGLKQVVKLDADTITEIFANTDELAKYHNELANKLEDFFLNWTPDADLSTMLKEQVQFVFLFFANFF